MSRVNLNCPKCNADLLVPESAAGRRARCSKCNARFIVPNAQELLDFQIAQMASEELGHRWHENEPENAAVAVAPAATETPPPPKRPKTVAASEASTGDTVMGVPAPPSVAEPTADEAPPAPVADHAATPGDYPSDPCRPPARPFLVVRKVDPQGVHFAFEARWLRDRRFQVSIPKRCAHSGERKDLSARPAVVKNRTQETTTRARSVEMHYEQEVKAKFSPFKLIDAIARLDEVKEPFDRPLLYYTGDGHTNDALECWGTRAEDGTDIVEIQIPHGEVALKWLERMSPSASASVSKPGAASNVASGSWPTSATPTSPPPTRAWVAWSSPTAACSTTSTVRA